MATHPRRATIQSGNSIRKPACSRALVYLKIGVKPYRLEKPLYIYAPMPGAGSQMNSTDACARQDMS